MSSAEEYDADGRPSRLAEAIREVKNGAADRDDVVIEMREAERMRLELFAAELGPVIRDVPRDLDMFDFVISSGLQPRFWIDAISHVSMGRDKRTFRFVRDTRLGRVVLAESTDMRIVADRVTNYIAGRLVERQRLLEGDVSEARPDSVLPAGHDRADAVAGALSAGHHPTGYEDAETALTPEGWRPLLSGLALILLGAIFAAGITASFYWERLDFSRLGVGNLF